MKDKKDKKMKHSRIISRRMSLEENQEQASRRTSPSYSSISIIFYPPLWTFSKSFVINS